MRSKMQPPIISEPDTDPKGEDVPGPASTRISASGRLLRRIAEALQVPPSVLYSPSNAVSPIGRADGDDLPDLDCDCVALLHAYTLIRDPGTRRGLLTLVQAAADREDAAPPHR